MHFLKAWSHVFLNVAGNYVPSNKSYESLLFFISADQEEEINFRYV